MLNPSNRNFESRDLLETRLNSVLWRYWIMVGRFEPLCLIRHEALEAGADVGLGHMDVVLLCDSR